MADFATLVELKARLDWVLDADEERDAVDALENLSEQARYYGKSWPDPATAPRLVKNLVLAATKRYLRNPDGYTQSRAGDETLAWGELDGDKAGSAFFTDQEIKMLTGMAGRTGLLSAPMSAWNTSYPNGREGLVPAAGGGDPVHMFSSDTEPW